MKQKTTWPITSWNDQDTWTICILISIHLKDGFSIKFLKLENEDLEVINGLLSATAKLELLLVSYRLVKVINVMPFQSEKFFPLIGAT